jgi:hypothetical protein
MPADLCRATDADEPMASPARTGPFSILRAASRINSESMPED